MMRYLVLLLLGLLLTGCVAGRAAFKQGEQALQEERYDQAVAAFLTAAQKNPGSNTYQMKLLYAREQAARYHKARGDQLLAEKDYRQAAEEYRLASDLDGSFFAAEQGAQLATRYLQAETLTAEAEGLFKSNRLQQAKEAAQQVLTQVDDYQPALRLLQTIRQGRITVVDGVELEVASDQPINLNFNDTKLPDVFDILTKLSGINFILDEDVRNSKTTLSLEKATFAQALELLLRMNELDKKVLNSKTIILFPKSRDKQKQFEDQLIQTFYLSNIDAKKAVNLLRTMLQIRKIYVHEELNAIVIRDTPEVIKLAQKILEGTDRADSEVVFDLELIEVSYSDELKFGPKLGAYELKVGIVGDPLNVDSESTASSQIGSVVVRSFKGLDTLYGLPSASFDLLKNSGNGEVLANPKIRVKNKEKAKVHIGSREPVVTVTINGDQTSENVTYVDVGVKLDVEPTIQLDNTVVTKLGLEVSNVSGRTTTSNGTAVLTISTTNANTALTLKDGERTIIGGLLRDSVTDSKTSVPILGDLPLLGRLFTSFNKSKSKSEILLSITPHIVKSVTVPEMQVASIWSGGEDDLRYGRNFGSFADDYAQGQQVLRPRAQPSANPPQTVVEPAQEQPAQEQPVLTDQLADETVLDEVAADDEIMDESLPEDFAADVVPVEEQPLPTPVEEQQPLLEPSQTAVPVPEESAPQSVAEIEVAQVQPTAAKAAPRIYIEGARLLKVGETLKVKVAVSDIEGLFSAPLYVTYNPQQLAFKTATEGSFLSQGGGTVFTYRALGETGRVIIGLKQEAGVTGQSGSGELFSMEFTAIAPGSSEVSPARTNFRNPQGERLSTEISALQVEIAE